MVDFLSAVIKALRGVFGDEYRIYSEKLNTGFETPAFVLSPIITSEKLFMGQRYLSENNISIRFYCKNPDRNKLFPFVCNKISESFETLSIDNKLYRGQNLTFKEKQDYLEINISYNYYFCKINPKDKMQILKINGRKV